MTISKSYSYVIERMVNIRVWENERLFSRYESLWMENRNYMSTQYSIREFFEPDYNEDL